VSQLGAGVYLLEVNDGQKTTSKKFVKINLLLLKKKASQ
jgi:hypothetical protein